MPLRPLLAPVLLLAACLSGGAAPAHIPDAGALRQLQRAAAWDASEVAVAAHELLADRSRYHSLGGLVTNGEADTLLHVVGQLCADAVHAAAHPPPPPPPADTWAGGSRTWLDAACGELVGGGFVHCGQHCVPRRLCFPRARPVSRPCGYLPGMFHCGLGRGGSCIPRGSSCTHEMLTDSFQIFAVRTDGNAAIEVGHRALALANGSLAYAAPAPTGLNGSDNGTGHATGAVGGSGNITDASTNGTNASLPPPVDSSGSWTAALSHPPPPPPPPSDLPPPPYVPRYVAFAPPPPPSVPAGLCLVTWAAGAWPRPANLAPQVATAPLPPGPYGADALPVRQNVSLVNGSVIYSLRLFGGLSLRLSDPGESGAGAQKQQQQQQQQQHTGGAFLRLPLQGVLQPLPKPQHRQQQDDFRYCAFHEPLPSQVTGHSIPPMMGNESNGSNASDSNVGVAQAAAGGDGGGGVSIGTAATATGALAGANATTTNASQQSNGTSAAVVGEVVQEDPPAWEWSLPPSMPSVEVLSHPFGCSKLLGRGQATPTMIVPASCTIPSGYGGLPIGTTDAFTGLPVDPVTASYCEAVFGNPREGVNLTEISNVCMDDPDGALAAQGSNCDTAMALVGYDCYYDVSGGDSFEVGTLARDVCPKTCFACVDDCDPDPCDDGGTCLDAGAVFACIPNATANVTGNSSNATALPAPYSPAACPDSCVYTAAHEVAAPEPEPAREAREDSKLILCGGACVPRTACWEQTLPTPSTLCSLPPPAVLPETVGRRRTEATTQVSDTALRTTTAVDFAVVLGPSVFTPLAPIALAYPSPRPSVAVATLVAALLLLMLAGGLCKLSLAFRREVKSTWPFRLDWFGGTQFARGLRAHERSPTLTPRHVAHALRVRWLLPGALVPQGGDPFDLTQRWFTLLICVLVALWAAVWRSRELCTSLCTAPCTAACYTGPTATLPYPLIAPTRYDGTLEAYVDAATSDCDSSCGEVREQADVDRYFNGELGGGFGEVLSCAIWAQLACSVLVHSFRWLARPYYAYVLPGHVHTLGARCWRRFMAWTPVAAVWHQLQNCWRATGHVCFVWWKRRAHRRHLSAGAYTARANRGKLSVGRKKGTELYGVDGIHSAEVITPRSWSEAYAVYGFAASLAFACGLSVVIESTGLRDACTTWGTAVLKLAAKACLLQLLGLEPLLVVVRLLAADFVQHSRWQKVMPVRFIAAKNYTDAEITAIFEELDVNDNGVLERAEVATLLKSMEGGLISTLVGVSKRFTEEDLDDALAEMDTDGRGGVTLHEFLTWWKEIGSQAKGALGAAMGRIFDGTAIDTSGHDTVAVWQRKLEQVLSEADEKRVMRLRVCVKKASGLPSKDLLSRNDAYTVCEMFGAAELPPEDASPPPHQSIKEHMVAIYSVAKPRKLADVDALLEEWKGEERRLLSQIREKYGVHEWRTGAAQRTSTVHEGGREPQWGQGRGELLIFDTLEVPSGLHFEVFDEDNVGEDDMIGSHTVELTGLLHRPTSSRGEHTVVWQKDLWLDLKDDRGRHSGELHVALHWGPRSLTRATDAKEIERTALALDRAAAPEHHGEAGRPMDLGDDIFDDTGKHEIEEWVPSDYQGLAVGLHGHAVKGVREWVAQQEQRTAQLCSELLNPFKVNKLQKQKRKALNIVMGEFAKRKSDIALARSRDWLAAAAAAASDGPDQDEADDDAASVGGNSSVGPAHIPRFVPPLERRHKQHGDELAKRQPNPVEQQRIKLGVGTGPVHLAVAVPPPHPEVTEMLQRREKENEKQRRMGPERPSTAARMRTMVAAVNADVRLHSVWRDTMKFKLDFVKELFDKDLITWRTAHRRQEQLLGEMEVAGVSSRGMGYAYNI